MLCFHQSKHPPLAIIVQNYTKQNKIDRIVQNKNNRILVLRQTLDVF